MSVKFSIEQQVIAMRDEVAISERTYAKLVRDGKLTNNQADMKLGLKRAILATLRKVEAHQEEFRAILQRQKDAA